MLLSVIITSYNREDFIAEAIESVLSSSYKDYELIISDDGSTDNTINIINRYALKDERIKIYTCEKNKGQFENRNLAASYAQGTYIKYLDSDDIIYPFSLQIMMDAMIKFPDAGLGFCIKYEDGLKPYPYLINPEDAYLTHYLKQELLMIGPSGLIIKKEAFDLVKGFEFFGMPSDNHLTLKIAGKYPLVALQRDLFWWQTHPGQVFTQNIGNHQNILNNYLYNIDILLNHSPLDKLQNNTIIYNHKKIFFKNLLKLVFKKARPIEAIRLFNLYLQLKQSLKT